MRRRLPNVEWQHEDILPLHLAEWHEPRLRAAHAFGANAALGAASPNVPRRLSEVVPT